MAAGCSVTKKGKYVDIFNRPTIVSVGVTSSNDSLPIPDVLLIAKEVDQGILMGSGETPELSSLLPLRYVRLSVHNAVERILRLQMGTHKVCYLQLHTKYPNNIFNMWSRLVEILQKGLSTTPKDTTTGIMHGLVPDGGSSSGKPFSVGHQALKQQGIKAASGDFSTKVAVPDTKERPKRVTFRLPRNYQADALQISATHNSIQGNKISSQRDRSGCIQ